VPLYEYKCAKCDHIYEKIQKFSDKPRAKCPECGGAGKRQLSAPAIHFKGTGWYITDYSRKGQPKEGEEKSGAEQKSGAEEKTSSDKKAGGDEKAAGKSTKKSKAPDKTKKN